MEGCSRPARYPVEADDRKSVIAPKATREEERDALLAYIMELERSIDLMQPVIDAAESWRDDACFDSRRERCLNDAVDTWRKAATNV